MHCVSMMRSGLRARARCELDELDDEIIYGLLCTLFWVSTRRLMMAFEMQESVIWVLGAGCWVPSRLLFYSFFRSVRILGRSYMQQLHIDVPKYTANWLLDKARKDGKSFMYMSTGCIAHISFLDRNLSKNIIFQHGNLWTRNPRIFKFKNTKNISILEAKKQSSGSRSPPPSKTISSTEARLIASSQGAYLLRPALCRSLGARCCNSSAIGGEDARVWGVCE